MSVSTLANLTALTHGAEPVLPIAYTAQSRPRAAGVSHWDSSTAWAKAGVSHWDKAGVSHWDSSTAWAKAGVSHWDKAAA